MRNSVCVNVRLLAHPPILIIVRKMVRYVGFKDILQEGFKKIQELSLYDI